MVDRVVVGAHYGLRDWVVQRISAVFMALYLLGFGAYLLGLPELSYESWKLLFSGMLMRSFSLLFLLCLFYHAWIGVRDIVMDYIKLPVLRLALHVMVIFSLLLYTIWSVQILWGI